MPVVAVHTVFNLDDIQKSPYRWAEVIITVDGIAPKALLLKAKEARDQLQKIMSEISQKDFQDPGDQKSDDGYQPMSDEEANKKFEKMADSSKDQDDLPF